MAASVTSTGWIKPLHCADAAIYRQGMTGDEAGFVGEKPDDGVSDLVRLIAL